MSFIIDFASIITIFITLYFMILFILILTSHKKNLVTKPKIKNFPSVSIIIPAHNEEKKIAKTIANVKKLRYPKKVEVIVVDDGSTDNTSKVAKSFKGVRVLSKPKGGKASALNFGLKQASGDIVTCIDSDSYPEQDALLKAIPYFQENVAAVTTSIFVMKPKSVIQRLQKVEYVIIAVSRKLLEYMNAIYVTPGPMSLYKRKILSKLGGFDEKNLTEDIEIAWRLLSKGYKIKMALDVKVFTQVPMNLKTWWHQRLRWNIGGIQTTLKYKNSFFSKSSGSIGTFVLPYFSISYFLSILTLLILFHVGFQFFNNVYASYFYGYNFFRLSEFYFLPDIFFFFGTFLLAFVFFYILIYFATIRKIISIENKISDFLIFIFVYLSLFPLNLIHSYFKFFKGRYKW